MRVIRRLVCQGEVTNHPHDAVKTLLAAFKSDVPQLHLSGPVRGRIDEETPDSTVNLSELNEIYLFARSEFLSWFT